MKFTAAGSQTAQQTSGDVGSALKLQLHPHSVLCTQLFCVACACVWHAESECSCNSLFGGAIYSQLGDWLQPGTRRRQKRPRRWKSGGSIVLLVSQLATLSSECGPPVELEHFSLSFVGFYLGGQLFANCSFLIFPHRRTLFVSYIGLGPPRSPELTLLL